MKKRNKDNRRFNDSIEKQERIGRRQALKEASAKIGKPFLLYRFIAAAIDILLVLVLAVSLFWVFSKTVFNSIGFYDEKKEAYELNKATGLFEEYDGRLYEMSYDEEGSKTIQESYEPAIIYYYTNDVDAINDGQMARYNAAKETSNLFDKVGDEYVEKSTAKKTDLLDFYSGEYQKALTHFHTDLRYSALKTRSLSITTNFLLLSLFIGTTIIYLAIPLCRKEGETVGQMIFKICLIDSRDLTTVKKWQIVMRYLEITGFNYLFPFIMLARTSLGMVSFLPFVVTIFMISLTKSNIGLHDLISSSHIILKHRAGALDNLKQITESNKQR